VRRKNNKRTKDMLEMIKKCYLGPLTNAKSAQNEEHDVGQLMPLAKLHNDDGFREGKCGAESVENNANNYQSQFVVDEIL
jgi:hypothetical protein